jgi:hypothetical protein
MPNIAALKCKPNERPTSGRLVRLGRRQDGLGEVEGRTREGHESGEPTAGLRRIQGDYRPWYLFGRQRVTSSRP